MNNKTLKQLYQEHHGKVSDKWSLYLSNYERLFCDYRDREINFLEIGIQNGGSLEIWANYFPHAKKLVGCDINPDCRRLSYEDQRIAVVIGNANLDDTEKVILSHGQTYDLIIDDGSHRSSDIVKSFARYFPHLADGGIFVVEDLHCSYWQEFEGGLFDPFSSITFFKRLADILNHEHWGVDRTRHDLLAGFARHYDVSFDEEVLTHIHSIEFINSVCVIRKLPVQDNESGLRLIVGEVELVQMNVKIYNNSAAHALNQTHNIWSARPLPPEEELIQRINDLAERDDQLASLNQAMIERDGQIASLNQAMTERDGQIASLNQAMTERDDQIASLNQAMTERDDQIASLNSQQSLLNVELLMLNAERATFGARIGRGITRLRARIAPVGTRSGSVVKLVTKTAISLAGSGWKTTATKIYRYASFRIRSKLIRVRASRETARVSTIKSTSSGTEASFAKVQADHPQLGAWIERNEPAPEHLIAQKVEVATFHYKPLLSVIVPIYKVPQDVLGETLASLEGQTYTNWQACIVWSDIDDSAGWGWLQTRTANDQRFKIKLLAENGGISHNSNSAFELVDGEYIALLDHDDTLTPWAFFEIVKRLQDSPELDFIYSDKDSITADGMIRLNALFKPEWSPEMLHSVNYLTHLNVIRASLVREIGGWRPETDGAQDWDLFFRITERTQNIARVPSILYHWRILPTSTATGLAAKPYAALGQLKSQQDYFMRRGLAASVIPSPEGMFKVRWPVHAESTDIIVYQNGTLSQLVTVLDVLRASKQESIRRIHVVHSTTANDTLNAFRDVWQTRVIFTQVVTANWRTALDAALSGDSAETIVLLDGHVTGISETMVEELSGWVAQHPDIAWASAIALNLDSSNVYETGRVVSANHQSAPLFSGSPLFSFGWFGGPLWYRNARACSPYAVAIKGNDARNTLAKQKDLDGSRDSFVAFCLELSANGRRGLIDPFARVYFSQSPEKNWPNEGIPYHVDPYFNPAFDQVSPLRLKS